MAHFEVDGRSYNWTGHNRLEYVRKGFLRRWVDATPDNATHVIHFWLPDVMGVWHATSHRV